MKIRLAERDDVAAIVRLLADDTLGEKRECATDPLPSRYHEAFAAIAADPSHELMVAELDGAVVGTLQLTVIPYLDYQGGRRGLIEAVRVAPAHRNRGIGAEMLRHAIERARERGCHLVQLTTDKRRVDARRFYERLGFRATHEGMKVFLVVLFAIAMFLAVPGSAQTGPIVNFFGPVSIQGVLLPCSEVLDGTPVCPLASATGFYLIAEGRPGSGGGAVGTSTFDPDGLPDLQIQTDHSLGNGTPEVCDSQPPSAGGVAPLSPPDLTFSDPGPVNDFACRFSAEPCTLDPFGEPTFLVPSSTVQFCATIDSLIGFASGDTRLSLRLRDTDGHVSAVRQIIVRVGGATPTPTRTPTSTSTGGASPTPTRTPTATASASPSATPTPTPTRTASAGASPTSTSTSASTATASPTPTVTASPGTPATSPTPTPSGVPPPCAGDCDQSLVVTVDELVRGIRIALGSLSLAECPDLDANNDGRVTIDEPVLAVRRALSHCPL